MTISFKALAALLAYPSEDLLAALPEVREVLAADRSLPHPVRAGLDALVRDLQGSDPLDAQERYVGTFDRGRAACLHLFEHVHGESRDRGQAMVDLKAMYEQAGLALAGHELPDYLPALLEFLSLQPFEVAEAMLGDCAHVVRRIGDALAARGSPYAAVFAAVLAVVDLPGLTGKAADTPEKPMDEEWAEAAVVFGPEAGTACGAAVPQRSIIQVVPRAGEAR
jgi:nitrate reductase delta subunit